MPPHGRDGRGHRFAAYPWCSTDVVRRRTMVKRSAGLVALALMGCAVKGSPESRDHAVPVVRLTQERIAGLVQHVIEVENASSSEEITSIVVGLRPDLSPAVREAPFRVTAPEGWRHAMQFAGEEKKSRYKVTFACDGAAASVTRGGVRCLGPGATLRFEVMLRIPSASLTSGPVMAVFGNGAQVVVQPR
jgi:hypothetical protein